MRIFAFADETDSAIDHQILAMKRNGLDGLEIRNVDGTNVAGITLEKAAEVRKKLDDNGLITWSVGSPVGKKNIDEPFEPQLENFKHILELSKILGAKNIRLFSFFMPKNEDVSLYKNKVIDQLGAFVEAAEGFDITLCHENEKGIYGDIPQRCLELHNALPALKAVFDPANFVQCGVDTLEAWEQMKQYVHYLHIKDALPNDTVVPPGTGLGNIKSILQAYLAQGGQNVTMEPHLWEFNGLKDLENKGEASVIGQFDFPDADAAFDAACAAFRAL